MGLAGSEAGAVGGAQAAALSVAVIGHVNHGKTTLVRALTGIETDRLKEEIARGLSITLGFAWRDYGAASIDFIDAPGHEDFIRAMVMGATGARAALLVVSAVDGVARQTREHLRIAGLLGLGDGVVAVTRSDLAAPGDHAAIGARIRAELEGSALAAAPMVFCSSVTGEGLEALHAELQALAGRALPPVLLPGAYLALDRVFSVAGAGTVATGTLLGGPLTTGDTAVLEPSGRSVVLRSLQVHGREVRTARPGGRVAVGLRGVSADEVRPGEALCAPGAYAASLLVDVDLRVSPESARPLRTGDEVRVMWGARQDMARVRLMGPGLVAPGARGLAQLRFTGPVTAFAGQRAVLRRPSPPETLGGALVLDPVAPRLRGAAEGRAELLERVIAGAPDPILAALAARDGGALSLAEAARLSRRTPTELRARLGGGFEAVDADRWASAGAVAEAARAYRDRLAEAHHQTPARSWTSLSALHGALARAAPPDLIAHVERRLASGGEIRLDGTRVALAAHDPFAALSAEARARFAEVETALRDGGASPPDPAALPGAHPDDPALVGLLIESGRALALRNHALRQTLVFHVEGLGAAFEALRAAFPPPVEFTTGEARAALATSRKFIVPLLEHFDSVGATARQGDVRRVTASENPFGVSQNPL